MSASADIVAHLLRVAGVSATAANPSDSQVLVADCIFDESRDAALNWASSGGVAVALNPGALALPLDLAFREVAADRDRILRFVAGADKAWGVIRSFHTAQSIEAEDAVLTDDAHQTLWSHKRVRAGHVFLIGTDLAADLLFLLQGDPATAANRPTEALWGFNDERPNYLYEGQLRSDQPHDRPVDWWIWGLRDALIRHANVDVQPVLPFGAPGAIIVTGDDDQAPITDYEGQQALLGKLPVTYFLHPLTKQAPETMAALSIARDVEWEIHPDALETPAEYDARFSEQAVWFRSLLKRSPRLVRNHGFLNDGYWGHAASWLKNGIVGSSNLPGVDGRVLNGSLLPARLLLDGQVTTHWSVLTLFGDGAIFLNDWDEQTAFDAIITAGKRIHDSGVPGLMVLNLHPANHLRAEPMHRAVRQLVESGFAAMTFGAAIEWFSQRDAGNEPQTTKGMLAPGTRILHGEAAAPIQTPEAIGFRERLRQTLSRLFA